MTALHLQTSSFETRRKDAALLRMRPRGERRNRQLYEIAMTMTPWPTSPRTNELAVRIAAFMEEHVYPAEPVFERQLASAADRWNELPIMTELKAKAKAAGLWNLFLPKRHFPDALTNLEYAPLCEIM